MKQRRLLMKQRWSLLTLMVTIWPCLMSTMHTNKVSYSCTLVCSYLKVTPDLRGCPRGKNLDARHFKGKHSKLYIVGKLNKCTFRKKYKFPVSSILQNKIAINLENDHMSFNWINRYQIQVHWPNNCTALIPKDQSSKVCQHFSIFWLVFF